MKRATEITRSIIMLRLLTICMTAFGKNDLTSEWESLSH